MSRQSATGRGRPAAVPDGHYDADPLVQEAQTGLCVVFTGEDDRSVRFSFAALSLPRLHHDLAHAFARRVGPTGGLRTEASARSTWAALGRLVRFLAGLARPPTDLRHLRASHLARYRLHRLGSVDESWVMTEIHAIRLVLEQVRPVERLSPDVIDYLAQRGHLTGRHDRRRVGGVPGYSEREFTAIMGALNTLGNQLADVGRWHDALAATAEVVTIQRRLAQTDPDAFAEDLAIGLSNLGVRLSDVGRWDEALTAADEALSIVRRLAQVNPRSFEPNVASTLINVAAYLSNLGRLEEALAAAEEAVALRRRLVPVNAGAHEPELASALKRFHDRVVGMVSPVAARNDQSRVGCGGCG